MALRKARAAAQSYAYFLSRQFFPAVPPRFSSTPLSPHPHQNDAAAAAAAIPTLQPSNDADSLSKILLNHHNPFHATESSLQLHGITLTPHLLSQTLLRLRHHSKIALSLFNYSKTLPDPPLTTSSYNLLVDIMGKVRQFDVAWQLIVEMDQRSLTPTPSTFLILIRRLVSAGLTRQVTETLYSSQGERLPTIFSINKAIFCVSIDTGIASVGSGDFTLMSEKPVY